MHWNEDLTKYLIPLAVSLAACIFSLITFYFWQMGREFRSDGVTAGARVVKKVRKPGGLENHWAMVVYRDSRGMVHTAEVKIASRAWHGLREGEITSITYLADQPERISYRPRAAKVLVAGILLCMTVCGIAIVLAGLGILVRTIFTGV